MSGRTEFAEISEWLSYEPDTGLFRWKKKPRNKTQIGDVAGNVTNRGYVYIKVRGARHFAHRLAWLFVHGAWPEKFIDHIDGNTGNNVIANLREATALQNAHNRLTKGYSFDKREKRFRASLDFNKTTIWLGYFDTEDAARSAYLSAHAKHMGEFSVTRRAEFKERATAAASPGVKP